MTNAGVYAQNLLFATLDPTMRRIKLPSGREIIISDTVGFISDLPHELIMSFRATLEEVLEADIIIHVRDISCENSSEQKKDVITVLHNLGLQDIEIKDNYIELLNKSDLLDINTKNNIRNETSRKNYMIPASALTGEGKEELLNMIDEKLSAEFTTQDITISAGDGKIISWLYTNSQICKQTITDDKINLTVKISQSKLAQLKFLFPSLN